MDERLSEALGVKACPVLRSGIDRSGTHASQAWQNRRAFAASLRKHVPYTIRPPGLSFAIVIPAKAGIQRGGERGL